MDFFTTPTYTLEQILAVSTIHPFYNPNFRFPPTQSEINAVTGEKRNKQCPNLESLPLIRKENLYETIQRLIADDTPNNSFRHASYISTTGGGSGGVPMYFLTDARENRIQRMAMGNLLRQCKVITPGDCVLSMHTSGKLYRSLDLIAEVVENAGGSIFCAGHLMSNAEIANLISIYRINVITGDSGQILQFAIHVSSLPEDQRTAIKINKILYTSEVLAQAQRGYIRSVLGDISICSAFASAESGPWAVGNHALTDREDDESADFIFDTRNIVIEVLCESSAEQDYKNFREGMKPLPDGEKGLIAATSLQRLRNPLIRYLSGDIGSLHPLPENDIIDPAHSKHFKVLRLYGRDQRFSFSWQGEYFDFDTLRRLMQSEELSVLQWQVIRTELFTSVHNLEVRILRERSECPKLSDNDLVEKLSSFFCVFLP
ncbi:hypothetical protein N7454_008581 [Penicillium verhagenii]|nr:hypothetical protein N7454_008581 [Penicillium verhagenii]